MTTELKRNEYRCAMCHEVFEMAWSDDEAKAEAHAKGIDPEDSDIVCDDCWKTTPWGRDQVS